MNEVIVFFLEKRGGGGGGVVWGPLRSPVGELTISLGGVINI